MSTTLELGPDAAAPRLPSPGPLYRPPVSVELHPMPGWTRVTDDEDDELLGRRMIWTSPSERGLLVFEAFEERACIRTELSIVPGDHPSAPSRRLRVGQWGMGSGLVPNLANVQTRSILVASAAFDAEYMAGLQLEPVPAAA